MRVSNQSAILAASAVWLALAFTLIDRRAAAQPSSACSSFSYMVTADGDCTDLTELSELGQLYDWQLLYMDPASGDQTYVQPISLQSLGKGRVSIRSRTIFKTPTSYGVQSSEALFTADCRSQKLYAAPPTLYSAQGRAFDRQASAQAILTSLQQGVFDQTIETLIAAEREAQLASGQDQDREIAIAGGSAAAIYQFACRTQ